MTVQFCLTAALTTRQLTRGSSISGGRQPAGGWTGGPTVGIGGLAASHLTSPVRHQRGTTSFLVYREDTSSPEGFATVFQLFLVRSRRGTSTRLTSHDGWHKRRRSESPDGEADGNGWPTRPIVLRKPALAKPQTLFGAPMTLAVRDEASRDQ